MKARSVLILEDDAVIASLLGELLVSMGHTVGAIEVTEECGIAAAARFQFDLIIADMWLRDGTGASAVSTILAFGMVPHILVSDDVQRIRGGLPYAVILQKPFSGVSLANAIDHAFETVAPREG